MTVMTKAVTVGRRDATGNDDDSETMTLMTTTVMVRTLTTDYDGDMIVIKMLVIDLPHATNTTPMNGSIPIDKDCNLYYHLQTRQAISLHMHSNLFY
jgi:hypothetical protein